MTEEELLPEMEVVSKEKKEKELAENYGRGRRSRPEVVYDDGLSESQFTRVCIKGVENCALVTLLVDDREARA